MLTLLPALLTIVGRWIFWPVRPTQGSPEPTERGLWARVGRGSSRRPRLVWVITAVVLGVMAIGMSDLKAHGISNADSFITEQDSIQGQKVLDAHFPAGIGDPLMVLSKAGKAQAVATALRGVSGIAPGGVSVAPVSKDGNSLVNAVLTVSSDNPAAGATVVRARQAVHAVPGADAKVAGTAAVTYDIAHASTHDRNVIIPLVLVVVFVILGLLLRALVAPVVLIATVVLSFLASLGVSAVVFDKLFGFKSQDQSFPLFVFVFLVALGIDYNIFLMTRIREESAKHGTRRGAVLGLATTGGVITSAGLVLAGTFAVLASLPLVAFAEIGFAVAFGVLLDTMIVRSVLVTSLTLDIGSFIWWPSALAHDSVSEAADAPITHEDDELAGVH
jgi:RND superfamily putative drug exporter